MIEVKDEILNGEPEYRLKDKNGNIIYDNLSIEMITEVLQAGTPLNKVLFDSIKNDILDRLKIEDKASTEIAIAGTDDSKYITPLKLKQMVDKSISKIYQPIIGQIFPTDWTAITKYYSYESNDNCGKWTISTVAPFERDGRELYNMFDVNTSTRFSGKSWNDQYLEIDCPIAIAPIQITIIHMYLRNGYISGYNILTNNWEKIGDIPTSDNSSITTILTLNNTRSYNKFRIGGYENASTTSAPNIYEFSIDAGFYKHI